MADQTNRSPNMDADGDSKSTPAPRWAGAGKIVGVLLWVITGAVLWELIGLPRIGAARIISGLLGLPVWIAIVLILKQVPELNPALKWLFPWLMMSSEEVEAESRMFESRQQEIAKNLQEETEEHNRLMWSSFESIRESFAKRGIDSSEYGTQMRKLISYPPDGVRDTIEKIRRTHQEDVEIH